VGDEEWEEVVVSKAELSKSHCTGAKIMSTKCTMSSGSSSGMAVKADKENGG